MTRFSFFTLSLLSVICFGILLALGISASHATISIPFSLLSPENNASELCSLIPDWEDSAESSLDDLAYTIFLSKDDPDFNDPILLENISYSIYLLTPDDGIEDNSDYYWKVMAIGEYGGTETSDTRQFHTDHNVN